MIETVAASATLPLTHWRDRTVRDWRSSRTPHGLWSHRAPSGVLPEGLGSVVVMLTPDEQRVRVEANLTSVRHGAARKWGSLHRSEVRAALEDLTARVAEVVPGAPADLAEWRTKRADPSGTYDVGGRMLDLLDSARQSWRRAAGPRHGITDHGSTVTWIRSKGESVSVYDKSAEAGDGCPPGLARLEVRRHLTGGPSLADLEEWVMSENELEQAIDTLASIAGESTRQVVEHLIRGGADAREAMRLAGPALLLAQYGEHGLVNLGMEERTARRTRSRIRVLLDAAGDIPEPDSGAAILRSAQEVYARDYPA